MKFTAMAAESLISLNDRIGLMFYLRQMSKTWGKKKQMQSGGRREREIRSGRGRNSEPQETWEIISILLPCTQKNFLPKILGLVVSSHQRCDARLEEEGCMNCSYI